MKHVDWIPNPYRSQYWDPGSKKLEERMKFKRTIKRPFVVDVGEQTS